LLQSAGFFAGAAIEPSTIACLRARRTASAFSLVALSEGFS
jgi:hypothetical protein